MKNIIHNAYIEIVAGIARLHSDGGVISEDITGRSITITFPDLNPRKALVRRYHSNGKKWFEVEYQEGQLHGKSLSYHNNGEKRWEVEYHHGQQHGKSLRWHDNGEKRWEEKYSYGKFISEKPNT